MKVTKWEDLVYVFEDLLPSHNNKDIVVLLEEEAHRSLEEFRGPRNRPKQIYQLIFDNVAKAI